MTTSGAVFDLAGVGIGPANLSLAALLAPSAELSTVFFDRKKSFEWHPGLMLPDARMQVHFLKDLVTPVDPTNPLSFPAFLVATKRLYRLLVTGRDRISRREFEQYCRWAADRIESLRFGVAVESLEWDGETFLLRTGDGAIRARNVVSGTGLVPRLPDCAAGHDPAVVFHAAHLLEVPRNFTGRRVAVVGGGQSGAEVVYHLLTSPAGPPESILWGTSRSNLLPLDDSPFVDELFLPNFSRYFYGLAEPERRRLIEEQRMASDGVSSGLLETIYRRLYDLELVEDGGRPCRILLGHQLTAIDEAAAGVSTTWRATHGGARVRETVDAVVCATGYRHALPELLHGVAERLVLDQGRPVVRPDFSLGWTGPERNRIYAQNAARHEFGVADPNLSLLAWRSAEIANSVLGYERFDTSAVSSALEWDTLSAERKVHITS